ncbi:MAG: hypothetical protein GKR86_11120 [Ilumatobacter sp.]|nr:hypothetical protein [Ilumatobacter sp.]
MTGTVATLVDDIRAGAPRAVRETKALLRRVPTLTRDVAFTEMAALSNRLFDGPDARIGMQAFRDKRRPNWNQSDT